MDDILPFIGGFITGFFGGLFPGLHSNTIISVLASLGIDDRTLAVMIISLYPAHLITSFVPSIFFGIPESSTVVAVLPGQRMVLRGDGLGALKTVLLSCIVAAFLSAVFFHISLELYSLSYAAIRGYMKYILLAISLVLLARSRRPYAAVFVFIVSGIIGHLSFDSGMSDPFLPLFSGMFAMAAMANYRKSSVPEQKDKPVDLSSTKFAALGVLLGFAADLVPGVSSPSQVATFTTLFVPIDTINYLATIGSVSVSQAIFSLSTSAAIDKSRVGATAWLSELMDISDNLYFILVLFILSMALATLLVYAVRREAAKIASLDFSWMNIVLGMYIVSITFIIDGMPGIIILSLASALGWLALKLEVERTNLMGAIIVPTLMLLFRIFI